MTTVFMTSTMIFAVRDDITALLDKGCAALDVMERHDADRFSVQDQELYAKYVLGYLHAAKALLNANAVLHDEMIEMPQFMRLRKLQRQYRQ